MPLNIVKKKLEEAIGLNVDSIGITSLESAVQRRMHAGNLETYEEYVNELLSSEDEIKYLIEEIVVPETWFFRDRNPFIAAGDYAGKIKACNANQPIRILTLPSATGEEPYSVAITLFEKGFSSPQFSINAIDVSKKSLSVARKGIYGRNSFRGEHDKKLVEKYFIESGDDYKISDHIQKQVTFSHGNILNLDFNLYKEPYDIIFCRNLLIYFDKNNKQTAFKVLDKLLKENGLLLVGHAEAPAVPGKGFRRSEYKKSFSFIKDKNCTPGTVLPIRNKRPEKTAFKKPKKITRPTKPVAQKSTQTIGQNSSIQTKKIEKIPSKASSDSLNNAKNLANIGELSEAKNICIAYLKENRGDSQAYFLLGLIAIASEELDLAEEHLRKSIYLNPKHYEALIHLSFLLEKSGDTAGADRLRKRADRNISSDRN